MPHVKPAGTASGLLAALSTFTDTLLATRGLPSKADVQASLGAGYGERHVLEVILAIVVRTLSN